MLRSSYTGALKILKDTCLYKLSFSIEEVHVLQDPHSLVDGKAVGEW